MGYGFSLKPMLAYIQKTRMKNSWKDPKALLDKLVVDARYYCLLWYDPGFTLLNKAFTYRGKPLPAIMIEENSKAAWVNSEALKRAGLDTPKTKAQTIQGGVILKNQYGEPNG